MPRLRLAQLRGRPRGGLAVNVGCVGCASWFNVVVVDNELAFAHRIDGTPPPGTRRVGAGTLSEAASPGPDHDPHPECPWCNGTGRAREEVFTGGQPSERELDCLCTYLRLSIGGAE